MHAAYMTECNVVSTQVACLAEPPWKLEGMAKLGRRTMIACSFLMRKTSGTRLSHNCHSTTANRPPRNSAWSHEHSSTLHAHMLGNGGGRAGGRSKGQLQGKQHSKAGICIHVCLMHLPDPDAHCDANDESSAFALPSMYISLPSCVADAAPDCDASPQRECLDRPAWQHFAAEHLSRHDTQHHVAAVQNWRLSGPCETLVAWDLSATQ